VGRGPPARLPRPGGAALQRAVNQLASRDVQPPLSLAPRRIGRRRAMNAKALIRALFLVTALYDGILGAVFLIAPTWPFHLFGVVEPNHRAYVQFPAALLIIFALMFLEIARAPERSGNLILYGVLLKLAYCGLAFGYWFTTGIPGMWKGLAVADLIMGVLFVWAFRTLRLEPSHAAAQAP